MAQHSNIANTQTKNLKSFFQYLCQKEQVRELFVLSLLFLIIGIIIHLIYPYPFVTADTGSYILGASNDVFNLYRPMGFSKYLQFLHSINPSIFFIFYASFAIHAITTLLLLFTAKYLFEIKSRLLFYSLCFFSIFAPRLLFCTNFIMSDGIFNSLTMLFLTTAIWIIYKKNWVLIICHLVIFAFLYSIRFSGMFYICISIFTLVISPTCKSRMGKAILAVLPVALFLLLYTNTKKEYQEHSGANTLSGFSGWQLINNASVLFPEAKQISPAIFKSEDTKNLHRFLQSCPDSLFNDNYAMNTDYMWKKELPYKQFLFLYAMHTKQNYSVSWAKTGELYGRYAKELILHSPFKFFIDFIIPSFLSNFNYRDIADTNNPFVNEKMIQEYYQVNIDKYEHKNPLFKKLNSIRKIMHYIYWSAFLLCLGYFVCHIRTSNFKNKEWLIALLLGAFIVIYIGTSSISSPYTTWRYTLPIYIPSLIFMYYNIGHFIREKKQKFFLGK